MNQPLVVAGAVGAALLVAVAIAFVAGARKRIAEAFQGFASARGLTFRPGAFPGAAGETGGRRVYVGNEHGGRRNPVVRFVIRIQLHGAVPFAFMAMARKLLTGAGTFATGDAAFDSRVWVAGDDGDAIRAYLTPERRATILELTKMGGWVVGAKAAILKGTPEIVWENRGMKPDARWIEERFAGLERYASGLDG